MSTKKKSNKKEHYVEDLRKRFDDIIKKCPKRPSFGRIVNLAIKNKLVKTSKMLFVYPIYFNG